MEFFRFKRDLPFMKYALIFNVVSALTFLVAVGALAYKGLHFGIDFKGGTVAELHFAKNAMCPQFVLRSNRLTRVKPSCRISAPRRRCLCACLS